MHRLALLFSVVVAYPACAISQTVSSRADSTAQEEHLPARVVHEAVDLFNTRSTSRFRGDSRIAAGSTVAGHVGVVGGRLTIAGQVRGRVVAINSDVILEANARVGEDILVIGGTVVGRELGRVRGNIRVYRAPMLLAAEGDSIVADSSYTDEGKWWSRYEPEASLNRSKITVRGETYNRIEGLPIHVGPSFRRSGEKFRVNVDALGIIRTADGARWDSENVGHKVDAELRMNRDIGIGIGGSLFDVVDPVERWQLNEHEAGLATFLLHRDFRDHYARHGGSLGLIAFAGTAVELRLDYSHESWLSRAPRTTWTLFRDNGSWRPNPAVHDGQMHVVTTSLRFDSRNSVEDPRSGWLLQGQMEHGTGSLAAPEDRQTAVSSRYSRATLDLRRYTRISPRGQLNARIFYGARLGDDELPLQKRYSIGGPGSLPGFDFRRSYGEPDAGMCAIGALDAARPAMCERLALGQLEYRGDIHVDIFGSKDRDDEDWREVGRHPGAQWVLFVNSGRGWLLQDGQSAEVPGLTYSSRTILPRLGTFRSDVGGGLDLNFIGIFFAKAVSQSGIPANYFIRLRHRF